MDLEVQRLLTRTNPHGRSAPMFSDASDGPDVCRSDGTDWSYPLDDRPPLAAHIARTRTTAAAPATASRRVLEIDEDGSDDSYDEDGPCCCCFESDGEDATSQFLQVVCICFAVLITLFFTAIILASRAHYHHHARSKHHRSSKSHKITGPAVPVEPCPENGGPCDRFRAHIVAKDRTGSDFFLDLLTRGDSPHQTFVLYEPLHAYSPKIAGSRAQKTDQLLRCVYHCNCTTALMPNSIFWSNQIHVEWRFDSWFEQTFNAQYKGAESFNSVCRGKYNIVVKTIGSIGDTTAFQQAPPDWVFFVLARDPRSVFLSRASTGYIPTPKYQQDIPDCCNSLRDQLRHFKHMANAWLPSMPSSLSTGSYTVTETSGNHGSSPENGTSRRILDHQRFMQPRNRHLVIFERWMKDVEAEMRIVWKTLRFPKMPKWVLSKIKKSQKSLSRKGVDKDKGNCFLKTIQWRSSLAKKVISAKEWGKCDDVFRALYFPPAADMMKPEGTLCKEYTRALSRSAASAVNESLIDDSAPWAVDANHHCSNVKCKGHWAGVVVKNIKHQHRN